LEGLVSATEPLSASDALSGAKEARTDARTYGELASAEAEQSLSLVENTLLPGFTGSQPHWHEHRPDMFHVLEGTLTVLVGDTVRSLEPGDFARIPARTTHSVRNESDGPVRFLTFPLPSCVEDYMRHLVHAARSASLTSAVVRRLAADQDFHMPPPRSSEPGATC
jgi:uncharacterized cupin superfamily protein